MARGAPTPAVRALDHAGVAYELHSFSAASTASSYGEAAAAALGVGAARVFKTLVADLDGGPAPVAVAVVAVTARLDLRSLARALGAKRAAMAAPTAAERLTGYVVGGISPFGQRRALPTLVDRAASSCLCTGQSQSASAASVW